MDEDIFDDKKNKNFIELNSQWSFYEMCQKKKIKLEQIIPQTIIFDKLIPKIWLFNPKKSKSNEIYKKNSDKLNNVEIVKHLIQMPIPKDIKIESLTQYQEILKLSPLNNSMPVAIAQMKRNEAIPLNRNELLQFFIEGKELNSVAYLQEFIPTNAAKSEVYYVEYRQEVDYLPITFKFYKKTLAAKRIILSKASIKQSNPFNPLLMPANSSQQIPLHKTEPKKVQTYFKFLDTNLNQRFSEESRKIAFYFEKSFKVKIRKLFSKFILDDKQRIYFAGIKQLFIELAKNSPYQLSMKEEIASNGAMDNFMMACKQFKKGGNNDSFHGMPTKILEDDKILSKTLYKHLILEKCQGDFCKYKLIEKDKGPLQLRKGLLDSYKNVFKEAKSTLNNRSTNLPYEISYQMIIRTRDSYEEVIQLFQKYRIYLENCNPEEHPEIPLEKQYPFINNNTEVQALINLYKSVKICKNCFIIYSMISRHFEQQLGKDIKLNVQFINTKLSELKSPTNSENKQITLKSSQSSRFRINKMPDKKKNFLISVIPDSRNVKTASPKKIREVTSQIEINRLSLGYLNYQKLDQFQKPINLESEFMVNSQIKQYESLQVNLIQMLADIKAPLQKRIDQNQNENKEQNQRNEVIKQILKNSSKKEQETRAAQREYYLDKIKESPLILINTQSHYYYHINMDVIRKIYQYQLSTPMKALTYELKYDKLRSLDINEVCMIMNYTLPSFEIPQLEYLIIDQWTAIPYALFESNITVQKQKGRDGKQQSSGIDFIIILHDMFESFMEYYTMIIDFINDFPNKRILVFNTPGQAHTLFSKSQTYSNIYIIQILDQILYELTIKEQIDLQADSIKIVGIGSGGFHALSYITQAYGSFQISQIVFINSFTQIYSQLSQFFTQSIQIFSTLPQDMPELAFEYTNTIMNTQPLGEEQLQSIIEINPIASCGRLAILEGLQQSPSFIERFQKMILSVSVYHSLKNCLVNVQEAESFQQFLQDESIDLNNIIISKKLQQCKRTLNYIEGGHSILYENQSSLINIFHKIIS